MLRIVLALVIGTVAAALWSGVLGPVDGYGPWVCSLLLVGYACTRVAVRVHVRKFGRLFWRETPEWQIYQKARSQQLATWLPLRGLQGMTGTTTYTRG